MFMAYAEGGVIGQFWAARDASAGTGGDKLGALTGSISRMFTSKNQVATYGSFSTITYDHNGNMTTDCAATESTLWSRRKYLPGSREALMLTDESIFHGGSTKARSVRYASADNFAEAISIGMEHDPAGYVDGANTYQFVHDSPTDQTDPIGLYDWAGHYYTT